MQLINKSQHFHKGLLRIQRTAGFITADKDVFDLPLLVSVLGKWKQFKLQLGTKSSRTKVR